VTLVVDEAYRRMWTTLAPRPEDARLEAAIDGLAEKEAQVVRLRFGMSGSRPRSIAEAAREVALAVDVVRGLESSAIAKLKRELGVPVA
jgi:DNA-directed RNA polymerase sigma subunit (sigma70/sigma32)